MQEFNILIDTLIFPILISGDYIAGSSDKLDLVLCNNSVVASLRGHLQGRFEDLGS